VSCNPELWFKRSGSLWDSKVVSASVITIPHGALQSLVTMYAGLDTSVEVASQTENVADARLPSGSEDGDGDGGCGASVNDANGDADELQVAVMVVVPSDDAADELDVEAASVGCAATDEDVEGVAPVEIDDDGECAAVDVAVNDGVVDADAPVDTEDVAVGVGVGVMCRSTTM